VGTCDTNLVGQDGNSLDDGVDIRLPPGASLLALRQRNADEQLSDRHCGDSNITVVCDDRIELPTRSFGVDEKGGVEQEQAQGRSSIVSMPRISSKSRRQSPSTACRRSAFLSGSSTPTDGFQMRHGFAATNDRELNRPGFVGGSRPWKRGWSHAT
jgi:hypothetical protein